MSVSNPQNTVIPSVIDCSKDPVYPEECPIPTEFVIDGCNDAVSVTLDDTYFSSLGRIVRVNFTLKSICPDKRVAASVILTELDAQGKEQPRGIKHVLIPAQKGEICADLTVKCIEFCLPEELDTKGNKNSLCSDRTFNARVIANYVDTDFICCDKTTV